MDSSPVQTTPIEEDEWDTDGFVIPSLGIDDIDRVTFLPVVEDSKHSVQQPRKEENIYLGPHGAPPSLAKLPEKKFSSNKQRFKQKLKDADNRYSGTGRENKVDNLRELVGNTGNGTGRENKVDNLRELVGNTGKMPVITSKDPRDWLDSHCHESQFERRHLH